MAKVVDPYERYARLLQGGGIPAGVMLGDALLTAVVAVRIGECQIVRALPLYLRSQSLGDDVEHWHLAASVALQNHLRLLSNGCQPYGGNCKEHAT